ncbi:tail fiber protein [Aliarcobacter butzleri]|uniref:phage tail protein n=1 Tax=Aliarcobacter butzleri TaxID=28197 RepID=UPI0028759DD8|nr:tail fiber protein [Aliarcobacter butzleri]MDS1371025.1 tail fiber protein [Aliarcobacter butzleri]
MVEEIKTIDKLTPFDEKKQALEGTKNFRENAAYSWSWLVNHTKELNVALMDFNSLVVSTFEKAQSVHYDAEQIEENTLKIEASVNIVKEITENIDIKFKALQEAGHVTKVQLDLDRVENTSYFEKPVVFTDEYFEIADNTTFEVKNIVIVGPFFNDKKETFDFQPGEYKDFAMPNPKGPWLFCNGDAVSRTKYKELFEVIGTRYGKGDGITTFNIPDRRGLFARTEDAGRGMDLEKRELGSYQADEIKNHSHDYYIGVSAVGLGTGSSSVLRGLEGKLTSIVGGIETRSKNITVFTCIRYRY